MANPVRTIDGTNTYIYAPTDPTDFTVINGASVEIGGVINSADTITLTSTDPNAPSSVKIDDTSDFHGNVVFDDGVLDLSGLAGGVTAWNLTNGVLSFNAASGQVIHFGFTDNSPEAGKTANIELSAVATSTNYEYYITEGALHQPAGASVVTGNLAQPAAPVVSNPPTTQPPAPPTITRDGYATIYDTTTQAYLDDHYSHPYMGPVAGLQYDCEPITPDSLNITARENSMFIKTSSGNDAIALLGGTNVVDAGTGSNFLTSGTGTDTFFLDARNVPAASSAAGPVPGAIWDTVQAFGHSDAVTLWGIGPSTALDWQKNQGAVGHTGLTLHANMPNGAEASLTLAGIDNKAGLQLSYGSVGGSSYLYIKAT